MNKWIRQEQLAQLILAHYREISREPGVLFWGIIFPILMALGLGVAFTRQGDSVHKFALVPEQSQASVAGKGSYFLDSLLPGPLLREPDTREGFPHWSLKITDEVSGLTTFSFRVMSREEAIIRMKRGSVSLIIAENGNRPEFQFDPLNPDAQLSYLKLNTLIRGEGHSGKEAEKGMISVAPMTLSGTRYIDFLVPGLMAMGVMMSCMWGLSYGIIDKRSKKLLRRMVATPMRKSHFLASLITVRLGMNLVEALLLFVFVNLAFGITVTGSIPALLLLFIAGNIAFAGIAIFLASHTSNTEVGNGLINAIVMPMMVLSGIFFSYQNFPDWSIPFIRSLPLSMLADGVRAAFIEGAGFAELALPIGILLLLGSVFFTIGLKVFKWY